MKITVAHLILFVSNQQQSTEFFEVVLQQEPRLNVPGMTEFSLGQGVVLGLMPETGAAKIVSSVLPHPSMASGAPRCELYLYCDAPEDAARRALQIGGRLISAYSPRDWGDHAVYVADTDGHVVAFAMPSAEVG